MQRVLCVLLGILLVPTIGLVGDIVVDGKVVSDGTGFQFPDGSVQSSAAHPKWSQVAIVDLNGNGDYPDPVEAMTDLATWCPSPSAATPCLVKILPGTYGLGTQTVTMQPYVDIEGSGRKYTRISTSAATAVTAADNSALRSLKVINESALSSMAGVSITSAEFIMSDVHVVVVSTGTTCYGIYASNSVLTAESFEVTVNGGETSYGIFTDPGAGLLRHAKVNVTTVTGPSVAEGMRFEGTSAPAVVESEVSVSAADDAVGIGVYGPDQSGRDVRIDVEAAGNGTGFKHDGSGIVELIGGWSWVQSTGIARGLDAVAGVTIARESQINASSTSDQVFAVGVSSSADLTLERVTVIGGGGTAVYGVRLTANGAARLTDVIVDAFDGSVYTYGIESVSSVPFTVERCTLTASGGGSWGVLNSGAGGEGGTIDHSTISGGNAAVRNDNSSADLFVGNSKLVGGVTSNLTCFGNYDATYAAVGCP
jgi:hypothetical protein